MGEWREYKISDIATLVKNSWKVGNEKLPYIGLEHIEESKLRLNGIGSSDDVSSNKYRFSSGDVLFGKLRPYFRKVVQPDFDGICSTDIWVINATDKSDNDFLFYFFSNQDLIDLSYSSSSGTRMPRADWKFLSQTLWSIPPLEEQKAIAEVLSSLDDKIDLLHRQNQTLEALAQTLFRQWFVEEAGDEWEETTLYDAIILVGGGTPKTSVSEYWYGDIPWLSGGDIASAHRGFANKSEKNISNLGLEKSSAKLLPKYATVISARGTVGKFCILSKPMTFSQSNYGVLPKVDNTYFFTYLLLSHSVDELQSAAYGSVFDTITTKTFKEHKVKLPSQSEIIEFEEKVRSYFKKIEHSSNQIKTLENMRDTLLPKLMSGEVRVRYGI